MHYKFIDSNVEGPMDVVPPHTGTIRFCGNKTHLRELVKLKITGKHKRRQVQIILGTQQRQRGPRIDLCTIS